MSGVFEFRIDCVSARCDDITTMVDSARDITFATFARRCNWRPIAQLLGYGRDVRLYLRNDYAVSFHRSTYRGARCYYLRWSAIEYVFTHAASNEQAVCARWRMYRPIVRHMP